MYDMTVNMQLVVVSYHLPFSITFPKCTVSFYIKLYYIVSWGTSVRNKNIIIIIIDVLVLDGPLLIIDPRGDNGTNDTMVHSIISKSHVLSVTSDSEAKFNDDDDEVSIIVLNTTATEKVSSLNYSCVFNAVKTNI